MNNNFRLLDLVTIVSFGVGLYALYIALINLDINNDQNRDLKDILDYLESHLQEQDKHLAAQDKVLENLTK